jgi:hypothetical protein
MKKLHNDRLLDSLDFESYDNFEASLINKIKTYRCMVYMSLVDISIL